MSADRCHEFARLHEGPQALLLPNAWDYASAAALFRAGFPAVATTSLGVALTAGRPDGVGATRRETVELVRQAAPLGLVSADAEGGFSEHPDEVADLAAELLAAGAAGLNLEDGRGEDALVDADRQAATIAAVKRRTPELFLNARVDTYWLGIAADVEETLRRAARYVEAGADAIFVPGVREPEEIRQLAAAIPRPLNVLFAPGAHTVQELASFGARRISMGSLLFRAALGTAVGVAAEVRDGSREAGAGAPPYAEVQGLAVPSFDSTSAVP
ncbi:MAG TPA: isocitrate lyase/phosphoenolpyruvate mutase family protein [Solirubrobacteraceae bacterium]|nr:isocitrate lyase/phosphoenolpyruvate mutase family protein [Solirubrobacteraceae bacterium]